MSILRDLIGNGKSRAASRRRRSLQMAEAEVLETKALLSNVSVELVGNDLRIEGDADDNGVGITQTPSGFIVRPIGDTTVNNRPINTGVFLPWTAPIDDVVADFSSGGANTVVLADLLVDDDVQYRGGSRQDRLAITGGDIGDDIRIRTQSGSDTVLMVGVQADSVNINTSSGADKVLLGGRNRDEVALRNLSINTGHGNDQLLLTDIRISNKVNISTGSGDDAAFIRDSQLDRDLRVRMSSGNDDFFIQSTRVSRRASVSGGSGTDHAQLFVNPLGNVFFTSIEGNVVADGQDRLDQLVEDVFLEFIM